MIEPALEAVLSPRRDVSLTSSSVELLTLARQLKEQTAHRIVQELKESRDAARRARAIEALTHLINDSSMWRKIYPDRHNQYAARNASLDVGLKPLLSALCDPDPKVQETAAESLSMIGRPPMFENSELPVAHLLAWLPSARVIPKNTVEYLIWTGHEAVRPALLEAFRERGRTDGALREAFVRLHRWEEAVPEAYASLHAVIANGTWETEARFWLNILGSTQRDGWARLHDVIRDRQVPLGVRVDAVRELLGQHSASLGRAYPAAYDDVLALRDEIWALANDDPQLKTINSRDNLAMRKRYAAQSLTLDAAKLDPKRGYPMLIAIFARIDDGRFRTELARALSAMQRAGAK